MAHRYSLRFESGDRFGEDVPLVGQVFSVGRKAGNSLQLIEASVSGQHAELRLEDSGVLLKDLGSTNGTRVDGAKISEQRVAHGQAITFGKVETRLLDSSQEAGDAPLVLEDPAGGEAHVVSAEHIERSSKKSRTGLLLVAVLVVAGAGAYVYLQSYGAKEQIGRAVQQVAGNLIATSPSFETAGGWEALDVEGSFSSSARGRYSGEAGISASLEDGERALHASDPIPVRAPARLSARAALRAPGSTSIRIGMEFSRSGESASSQPVRCFSEAITDRGSFQEVEFQSVVPSGYDQVRFLVLADAQDADGGTVAADDAVLLKAGEGGPVARLDEYRYFLVGQSLNLFKVDRTLLSGLSVVSSGSERETQRSLALSEEPNAVSLGVSALSGDQLTLFAEGAALEGGMASMGLGGYLLLEVDFEEEGVTDLLFGQGVNLVRLSLGVPCSVRGRRVGEGFALKIELTEGSEPALQVRFKEERTAAINLAADAEAAEREGRLGDCLAAWQRLLDQFPFEAQYVSRAEAVQARLTRLGLDQLRAVHENVERAQFFRLVELYRQCRAEAQAVADAFKDSEVELQATQLVERVNGALASLESDLQSSEMARLTSILAVLEAQGATGLAGELKAYLEVGLGEEVR